MESLIIKKIGFITGVSIDFIDNQVLVTASNYKGAIDYKNLDNYTYSNISIPRISPIGLSIRTLFFGLILAFVIVLPVKDEWGALFFTASFFDILLAWLSIIIVFGSLIISGLIMFGLVFSVFMETSFLSRFINKNFSDHNILSIIGNKSGNNIKFYALREEIEKVKQVEKIITDIKKSYMAELILKHEVTKSVPSDYLEELTKLNELYKQGILTEIEFTNKKTEILNRNI